MKAPTGVNWVYGSRAPSRASFAPTVWEQGLPAKESPSQDLPYCADLIADASFFAVSCGSALGSLM